MNDLGTSSTQRFVVPSAAPLVLARVCVAAIEGGLYSHAPLCRWADTWWQKYFGHVCAVDDEAVRGHVWAILDRCDTAERINATGEPQREPLLVTGCLVSEVLGAMIALVVLRRP